MLTNAHGAAPPRRNVDHLPMKGALEKAMVREPGGQRIGGCPQRLDGDGSQLCQPLETGCRDRATRLPETAKGGKPINVIEACTLREPDQVSGQALVGPDLASDDKAASCGFSSETC